MVCVRVICVGHFPRGEVSVKVGVMEFELNQSLSETFTAIHPCAIKLFTMITRNINVKQNSSNFKSQIFIY